MKKRILILLKLRCVFGFAEFFGISALELLFRVKNGI